jgi:hypothetical protein
MTEVRDRLREQPLPGEAEAAARAWPVVEAALSEREASEPGTRVRTRTPRAVARLALAAALVAGGLLAALTPAGAEVGDWIGDRFASDRGPARPAFAALPEGGSVLALSRTGAYAVHPDGSSSWLGPFSEAGWSPRGLHVVGVDGRRVVAVTPDGTPRWTLARRRPVHHPAWSLGEGFVVAYLEGRAGLRAVGGNGDPATDRMLRRDARPVTPAWRPGARYLVTYVSTAGFVETLDAISGESVWRAEPDAGGVRALAWSRDGRRLVALSSRSVTVLSGRGRVLRTIPLPGAGRELALHPSGRRAAVLVTGGGERRVLEQPLAGGRASQLFQGDVDGLSWSADGRHLLLAWRDTGEWLLLGPGDRIRALHDVSGELGNAGGFPRVAGWCCPG